MEKATCELESFNYFAFGLGEFVSVHQDAENVARGGGWRPESASLKVISRQLVEDCTGSIQRLYGVRMFSREGASASLVWFQELELCKPLVVEAKKEG